MQQPTIHLVETASGKVWRVCYGGTCRDHAQQWQAKVFLHQMQQAGHNETPPTIAS